MYKCEVCGYIYDELKQELSWDELPDDWNCPVCESPKTLYELIGEEPSPQNKSVDTDRYLGEFRREEDEFESSFAHIQWMAENGRSVIEPMRTRKAVLSWDELLIKGAQLARLPLNEDVSVNTRTIIGPRADTPLVLETPVYITHMSFGALSREVKIALSRGSAGVQTAMCSGEGGILEESLLAAHRYIFEYVPNEYSVSDENFKRVDAVEIKIGQSSKPGLGGHLPGKKVTDEISKVRGFPVAEDIISPAHFKDVTSGEQLKAKVDWLREKTGGKPVGIKLAAGHIEQDLDVALFAQPDFITIDGRPGATGASPKFVKDATSIPTIFALYRARKHFDRKGVKDVSLVITGGLRISADFAKAIALGADAVAIGTAALIACACQQYRSCNLGTCPVGVTTQDPELRARLDVDRSAERLENFLRVSTDELKDFARMTGNTDIHDLAMSDLCTTASELSTHTDIEHV